MKQDKWDKLNKELDDALEAEFGSEEPKQETLEEEFKFKNRQIGAAGFVRNKIMENMSSKFKQETVKEASENYANMHQDVSANLGKPLVKGVFEDGATWQAERMYSQDEILMAMGYAIGVSSRGSLSHEEVKASCIDFVERLNKK